MKIKICGLSRQEDIEIVNRLLPDYIGFIFAKSKRQVSKHHAKQLKALLDPHIQAFGVFIDEDAKVMADYVKEGIIDGIQLHGHEDQRVIDAIRERVNCPIIKAVKPGGACDFTCEYLLFDGVKPGSGQVFNWQTLPKTTKPFFLAGGLSIDNIGEAMKTEAFALDISSGVETEGKKDEKKIEEVIRRIRNE